LRSKGAGAGGAAVALAVEKSDYTIFGFWPLDEKFDPEARISRF
jgi:hypothetical protein